MDQDQNSFTGRTRERRTKRSVHVIDFIARSMITMGGLMTVVAVFTVCLFLVWVVVPLFMPASTQPPARTAAPSAGVRPLFVGSDEYRRLGWALYPDSTLNVFRLDNGKSIVSRKLFESPKMTAAVFSTQFADAAFGFDDGSVRLGRISFGTTFIEPGDAEPALQNLKPGDVVEHNGGLIEKIPSGQLRTLALDVKLEEPVPTFEGTAITHLDAARSANSMIFAALGADGRLIIESVRARKNIMTGKVVFSKEIGNLPYDASARGKPAFLRLSGLGDNVFVAWEDGTLTRYDTRDYAKASVTEELDLTPEPGARLTALEFLIGKSTLVSGDSLGNVRGWFRVKPQIVATLDGGKEVIATQDLPASVVTRLVRPNATQLPEHLRARADALAFIPSGDNSILLPAHQIGKGETPVVALASSARTRLLAASFGDGSASLYQVTSHKHLAALKTEDGKALTAIAISPKDDGMVGVSDAAAYSWAMDIGYPEVTVGSLFTKVWYEGYEHPEHVWQSVGGTDDFEPKLGFMPLVLGTIKATFYSLMFGVPIALLAAVYTSEFLSPRARGQIKPAIETMASLPSVVLGFIAALVIAPAVEDIVPAILCSVVCIPVTFLIAAYLWQLVPYKVSLRVHFLRLPLMVVLVLPLGVLFSYLAGPVAEHWLFADNIKLWLNWKATGTSADVQNLYHSAVGGWMLLFIPISTVLVGLAIVQFLNPFLRPMASRWERHQAAMMDIVKFIFAAAATVALAFVLSWLVSAIGFDARGTYIDTYASRNAMVVGLIMGFAIIPIVYTISDDALSSVPRHLRSASLGAGATQWQTTIRIIVPTAMSGLFSAVMIGVGRAVGETMIVLMAAGNTPVMEMNIFNGFRTLSANIAVELPEAVKNSTHFRTLFLAALTLFAMTFVLNTIAEMVRLRFRKRAFQL